MNKFTHKARILGATGLIAFLFSANYASAQITNAYDVASNYSGFSGNQGYGFGAWVVNVTGSGGAFIQTSGPSGKSFDLWNATTTGNAASTAVRPFSAPLSVGGSFSWQSKLNSLDFTNFTNAVQFLDASGNVLFSYWHVGQETNNGANGAYSDASTSSGVATGFAYNYGQFNTFTFTLNSATTYTFSAFTNGTLEATFSGSLSGAAITQVAFVRANGLNGGAGQQGDDFQFDELTLTSSANSAPAFTVQPSYQGGLVGSTLNLNALASSSQPISYQWYHDNVSVSGATSTNLVLSNVTLTNAGNYWLVASNIYGASTSSVAVVTVYVENNRILAYEGFDYTNNTPIDGVNQNGGSGWSGPWVNVVNNQNYISNPTGSPGSLIGSTNAPSGYDLLSTGNTFYTDGNSRAGRFLDCSTNGVLAARGFIDAAGNVGAAGKTIYVSFLMQPDTTSSFYEFEFHRGDFTDANRISGIGNDTTTNDVYLRHPDGTFTDLGIGDSYEDPTVGNLAVDFYVVRIDFHGGTNDDVSVYRNPTSLTEPATPTAVVTNIGDMSFDGIALAAFSGNFLAVDEIRVGATWQDALGMTVPFNILGATRQGGNWNIQFIGNPSFTYRVLRATSITGPWTSLGTATPSESGVGTFTDTNPPASQAFYRTVTP